MVSRTDDDEIDADAGRRFVATITTLFGRHRDATFWAVSYRRALLRRGVEACRYINYIYIFLLLDYFFLI